METLVGPPGPPDPDAEASEPPEVAIDPTGADEAVGRRPGWASERVLLWVDIAILACLVLFIFLQMGPRNIFTVNTPTGGDMGSHVWGPAFLRDHLLPSGRLSGWTPDWYAGFPAYQFYMVVPALFVVVLNVGLRGWAAVLPVAAAAVLAYRAQGWVPGWKRTTLRTLALVVLIGGVGLPYGVAFKLVTVAGLLALPLAVYALGRLAALPFPTPIVMASASLVYLFNIQPLDNLNTGNIIGGNATSTMAGEFSFAISMAFAVLYLGVVVGGLRTGRFRVLAAVLLGLTALCHVIPFICAGLATLLALVVWPGRKRLYWALTCLPVGGFLAAFWMLPFVLKRPYLNDMGWEKLPDAARLHPWHWQFTNAEARDVLFGTYLFHGNMRLAGYLALTGFVVAVLLRNRLGIWLGLNVVLFAVLFVVIPDSRLWNARLLPFFYLCLVLLAALAVAELGRAVAQLLAARDEAPRVSVELATAVLAALAALAVVGLPLKSLPYTHVNADGTYEWRPLSSLEWFLPDAVSDITVASVQSSDRNPVKGWANWNFTGLEDKQAYPEFHGLVSTMQRLGENPEFGCGQSMWEFESDRLNTYGTPMAPMMLSYFTDGCIGSMEGLFFESSATTPFHFINQDELSLKCSCAQRALPYGGMNLDRGVQHLQLLGVKYYLTSTPEATAAADGHPDLTPVTTTGPWHIYEVEGAERVVGLPAEPVVVTTHDRGIQWVYGTATPHGKAKDGVPVRANGPALDWYLDPARWDVMVADAGPDSWQRFTDDQLTADPALGPEGQAVVDPERRTQAPVEVSEIDFGQDTIDFDVDQVGVPVLVKASYFPNWKASGAEGPYRVAPNLMVVIPTSEHVRLRYGWTGIDIGSYLLTLAGLGMLVFLARLKPVPVPDPDQPWSEFLDRFRSLPVHADYTEAWPAAGYRPGQPAQGIGFPTAWGPRGGTTGSRPDPGGDDPAASPRAEGPPAGPETAPGPDEPGGRPDP